MRPLMRQEIQVNLQQLDPEADDYAEELPL
jgi:hypothetical protein